jgi:uncharacterized protein YndB with AHSA1/START domain
MTGRFATLTFERAVSAPVGTLWQAWTAPAARAVWASPAPSVTVEFLEADPRVGGREVSLCKVAGQPDIRCECGWLEMQPARLSVNTEVIFSEGVTQSAALVTADLAAEGEGSRLVVTVQLSSLAEDMEAGYRQGFGAGLDNLAEVALRTMVLQRVIKAVQGDINAINAFEKPATGAGVTVFWLTHRSNVNGMAEVGFLAFGFGADHFVKWLVGMSKTQYVGSGSFEHPPQAAVAPVFKQVFVYPARTAVYKHQYKRRLLMP